MKLNFIFLFFLLQLVASLKIEGGSRKPEMSDLFIVQAVMFPLTVCNYASTYYRRYISTEVRAQNENFDSIVWFLWFWYANFDTSFYTIMNIRILTPLLSRIFFLLFFCLPYISVFGYTHTFKLFCDLYFVTYCYFIPDFLFLFLYLCSSLLLSISPCLIIFYTLASQWRW